MLMCAVGYPLAMVHRQFFYGRSPNVQHIFFTICGLSLCYFNFGTSTDFHLMKHVVRFGFLLNIFII